MHIVRLIFLACGLFVQPTMLSADTGPVLARLEFSAGLLFPTRASIHAGNTVQPSPFAGKPKAVWVLRAGDVVSTATAPPDRIIRFYRAINNGTETVCTVIVRYVMDSVAWRPTYQMLVQPRVTFNGTRLVPLPNTESARGVIRIFNGQNPDWYGFYSELAFGYTSVPMTIDAWEVQ